jgi:hypothetical protein
VPVALKTCWEAEVALHYVSVEERNDQTLVPAPYEGVAAAPAVIWRALRRGEHALRVGRQRQPLDSHKR